MNFTLRKANTIQPVITDAIKGIEINLTVPLTEFEDPYKELQKANSLLFKNDQRRKDLLIALYFIRSAVGRANVDAGVDALLADVAFTEKRIAQLTEIVESTVATSMDVIKGKLSKLSTDVSGRRSLYGDDSVTSGVATQDQIDAAMSEIKNLKKQKQKMKDEIVELNIKTTINISSDIADILTLENLI